MSEQTCELPSSNPPDEEIQRILRDNQVVAIVGLSPRPDRDSNQVARYLLEQGYTVVPVNPGENTILGLTCYPDVRSVPFPVDIVDIFRKMEFIPAIVDQAIEKKARVVWMQLGLAHNASAEKARQAGIAVVMAKCIKVEHSRLRQHAMPAGAPGPA